MYSYVLYQVGMGTILRKVRLSPISFKVKLGLRKTK